MHTDRPYTDPAAVEIVDLHRFFEDWFTGACTNSEEMFSSRLLDRMDSGFHIVLPGGRLMSGNDFWPDLRGAYGSNPDFGISIRNFRRHAVASDGVVLATYEEWQRNARNSEPPNNARISTVVFSADENTPNGLIWMHVHETWLPAEQIRIDGFDW